MAARPRLLADDGYLRAGLAMAVGSTFASAAPARLEVWKNAGPGGPAIQVTGTAAAMALESTDGKYLYYDKDPESDAQFSPSHAGRGRPRG